MPALEDFLRRFRPLVAPPGQAGPGTVAADRTTDLLAELSGVLSAIDRVEDDIAGIEAAARSTAEQRLAAGRADAARCVAGASEQAEAARAAAYAERRGAGESAIRRDLERAEQEARRIRQVAAARSPALVETVVRRVLDSARE